MDLVRNRTLTPPFDKWVEQELAAPIGVFLPSIELIVDSERNTLLESTLRIGSPSDDEPTHL